MNRDRGRERTESRCSPRMVTCLGPGSVSAWGLYARLTVCIWLSSWLSCSSQTPDSIWTLVTILWSLSSLGWGTKDKEKDDDLVSTSQKYDASNICNFRESVTMLVYCFVLVQLVNQREYTKTQTFLWKNRIRETRSTKEKPRSDLTEVCDGAGSVTYEGPWDNWSSVQNNQTNPNKKTNFKVGIFYPNGDKSQAFWIQPHFKPWGSPLRELSRQSCDRKTSTLPGMTNYHWNKAGHLPWPANKN